GIMIRVPVEGIRISGRNTQGVKVMNLTPGDLVVDVARVVKEDDAENGDADDEEGGAPSKPGSPKSAAKRPGKKKKKKPYAWTPPRTYTTRPSGCAASRSGRRAATLSRALPS